MFWSAIFALLSGLPGSGGPAVEPGLAYGVGPDRTLSRSIVLSARARAVSRVVSREVASNVVVPDLAPGLHAGRGAAAVGRALASVATPLTLPSDRQGYREYQNRLADAGEAATSPIAARKTGQGSSPEAVLEDSRKNIRQNSRSIARKISNKTSSRASNKISGSPRREPSASAKAWSKSGAGVASSGPERAGRSNRALQISSSAPPVHRSAGAFSSPRSEPLRRVASKLDGLAGSLHIYDKPSICLTHDSDIRPMFRVLGRDHDSFRSLSAAGKSMHKVQWIQAIVSPSSSVSGDSWGESNAGPDRPDRMRAPDFFLTTAPVEQPASGSAQQAQTFAIRSPPGRHDLPVQRPEKSDTSNTRASQAGFAFFLL